MGIGSLSESINVLLDLPDDSFGVILSIYRADIHAERSQVGGNADEVDDSASSILTAIEMQLDELENHRITQIDARIAQSITDAKLSDLRAIAAAAEEEKQATDDHEFARRLAGPQNVPQRRALNQFQLSEQYSNAFTDKTPALSKLAGQYVSKEAGKALFPSSDKMGDTEENIQCVVCLHNKSYFEVVSAPCGHQYCKGCIQELFRNSFNDDTLFPPRCCKQHIEHKDISYFLTRSILQRFEEKTIEFNTVDKTYCSNKACSTFIMPTSITINVGTCGRCGTLTCVYCKAQAHGTNQCEEDPAMKAILALASTEGWRRCARCSTMIELRTGCYHMTCTCGNQFCYLCGAHPWKTCRCIQWHDDRLTERTNHVQARQRRTGAVEHAVIRRQIVERHNCEHDVWQSTDGGECDECGHDMPVFLYRCTECHVEFCRRCRNNRVR